MGCLKRMQQELHLSNAKLSFGSCIEFINFGRGRVWTQTTWVYFRAVLFLYAASVMGWSAAIYENNGYGHKWLIYFTHWSIFLESLYLGLALWVAYVYLVNTVEDEETASPRLVALVKLTWCLRNAIGPGSFLVMLLFWTLVFNGSVDAVTVQVHGVNWIVMAVDFFLSCAPFRILHGWGVYTYVGVYLLFSAVYFAAGGKEIDGGRNIYEALKWGQLVVTLITAFILAITVAPLAILIQWSVSYAGATVLGEGAGLVPAHVDNISAPLIAVEDGDHVLMRKNST